MGMMMPISRRLALLDWAERAGTYLIEDDYDGEFRYSGRPIPSSMQGLRENAPVIYMGGFSQVLAPAFCVHYMVIPKELLPYFAEVYRSVLFEQSASRLYQRTLELFIQDGELGKHIRKGCLTAPFKKSPTSSSASSTIVPCIWRTSSRLASISRDVKA